MNWFDIIAIAVLGVFLLIGLFRGLKWMLGRILILLISFVAAGLLGPRAAALLAERSDHDDLPQFIGALVVFVVVLVVLTIVSYVLGKRSAVEEPGRSPGNRITGALLGVGAGGLVQLALLTGVHVLSETTGIGTKIAEAAADSEGSSVGRKILHQLGDLLPGDSGEFAEAWSKRLGQ